MNYYNEFDSGAAAWLRELIAAGHIPDGIVDERSIEDVRSDELLGYTQCHFFAGIGGWPLALRLSGWPDDRPIWTGSCPCQPFSAAGKGDGFADERHLWPSFYWLIQQCRPPVVAGEQVASKAVDAWIDLVQADLEALGYAFGSVPFPTASVGAPHIRDRNYWVGHSISAGLEGQPRHVNGAGGRAQPAGSAAPAGSAVRLADTDSQRRDGIDTLLRAKENGRGREGEILQTPGHGEDGGLADAGSWRVWSAGQGEADSATGEVPGEVRQQRVWSDGESDGDSGASGQPTAGPTNGHWGAADWLLCRDGKWRPVVASYVALADGLPAGMGSGGDEGREKEAQIDGQASEESTREELRPLSGSDGAKEDQRPAGGFGDICTEEILRPGLHGGGDAEGPLQERQSLQKQGGEVGEGGMRDMRGGEVPARSPQEPGPFRQLPIELDDLVRVLPQEIALAKLAGRWRESSALQVLSSAICEEGHVQYAPEQAASVWASLGEEAQDRIRLGFDVRDWRRVVFHPLSTGEKNRVMRLKGYGNAIVPQQAAIFIEAVMSCQT